MVSLACYSVVFFLFGSIYQTEQIVSSQEMTIGKVLISEQTIFPVILMSLALFVQRPLKEARKNKLKMKKDEMKKHPKRRKDYK